MPVQKGSVTGKKLPPEDLFLRKVQEIPEEYGGCWIWSGGVTAGYGIFTFWEGEGAEAKRYSIRAHRWSYQHFVGLIPDGLTIDHLCRVTRCVRPDHLEPVTSKTNILRGTGLAPKNAAKTKCPHGHKYTEENTYVTKDGKRVCRECGRIRNRAQYLKRKVKT